MTESDLEAAWADVHEHTPDGWYVGRPMEHPRAAGVGDVRLRPSETPVAGKRSREWTTVAATELEVVRSMAYCLGELKAGRWPK